MLARHIRMNEEQEVLAQGDESEQSCKVCFEKAVNDYLKFCPCNRPVHHECLKILILYSDVEDIIYDEVGVICLECKYEALLPLEPARSVLVTRMERLALRYKWVCEKTASCVAVIAIQQSFLMYGLAILNQIYGREYANLIIMTFDPLLAVSLCQVIPIIPMAISFSGWEDKLLLALRKKTMDLCRRIGGVSKRMMAVQLLTLGIVFTLVLMLVQLYRLSHTENVSTADVSAVSKTPGESDVTAISLVQKANVGAEWFSLNDTTTNLDQETIARRDTVKQMMKHAWDNYVRYAWGENELSPLSKRAHEDGVFSSAPLGATIVDGLDTLYIMGLMDEFKQGRNWIADNYSLNQVDVDLSVFETNIRFVGGLLSCFALTGDVMFKEKAEHTAQKLLPAFQTQTGIPNAEINPKSGKSYSHGWLNGGTNSLAGLGTLSMEFGYLSDVTGNSIYHSKVQHVKQFLKGMKKPDRLYPVFIYPKTGTWGEYRVTTGGRGDSFYEYLLKEWLRSGREDQDAREMYDEAMDAIFTHLLKTSVNGLMYFAELKNGEMVHKMDHLSCIFGGLLALGAHTLQNNQSSRYMEVAKGITHTCHESYDRTSTKLGPECFRFTDKEEAKTTLSDEKYYILRPEVVETYFYMWRLTKDPKYREWGWEVVLALQKHCWTPTGFSGIEDVYDLETKKDDVQQSFFLAETLKYLYLLFSDDSLISLDEWVFNTEAHPLPIKGTNFHYQASPTTLLSSPI